MLSNTKRKPSFSPHPISPNPKTYITPHLSSQFISSHTPREATPREATARAGKIRLGFRPKAP